MARPTTGGRIVSRQPLGQNPDPCCSYNDYREALLQPPLPEPDIPRRHTQRIYVARRYGKPVFYEYGQDGKLVARASYLPKRAPRRNYYQVGDVILTGKRTMKWVCALFPEFRPKEGDSLLVTLAKMWMGPPEQYVVGFRVEKIEPIGKSGQGMITVRGVVFFGENILLTEYTSEKPSKWVHDDFAHNEIGQSLMVTANVMETFMQILTEVGTSAAFGGLTAATKKAAERRLKVWMVRKGVIHSATRVMKEQVGRLIARQWLKKTAVVTAKATIEFAKAFATKLLAGQSEDMLRGRIERGSIRQRDFDQVVIRNAVQAGATAFATAVVNETFGKAIGAAFEKSETLKSNVSKVIAEEITTVFTVQAWNSVAMAMSEAVMDMREGKAGTKRFSEVLADKLGAQLTSYFLGKAKDVAGVLPGRMAETP